VLSRAGATKFLISSALFLSTGANCCAAMRVAKRLARPITARGGFALMTLAGIPARCPIWPATEGQRRSAGKRRRTEAGFTAAREIPEGPCAVIRKWMRLSAENKKTMTATSAFDCIAHRKLECTFSICILVLAFRAGDINAVVVFVDCDRG